MKLWEGRFQKGLDKTTNDFNASIAFDSRMYEEDIRGSIAHATMLGACGIIAAEEAERICAGLEGILQDLKAGTLQIDPEAEDIHTFIEGGVDGADRRCGEALAHGAQPQRPSGAGYPPDAEKRGGRLIRPAAIADPCAL